MPFEAVQLEGPEDEVKQFTIDYTGLSGEDPKAMEFFQKNRDRTMQILNKYRDQLIVQHKYDEKEINQKLESVKEEVNQVHREFRERLKEMEKSSLKIEAMDPGAEFAEAMVQACNKAIADILEKYPAVNEKEQADLLNIEGL